MRVSDNTSRSSVHDALGRTRSRIEDLQLKNSTLKKLNAPSDDPVANAKIMDIRTQTAVNGQFEANGRTAKDRLQHTETAIGELTDILMRIKELALNQSSGPSATRESRLGVAQEVSQLSKQVVAIANRRVGDHYLFSGYKTLKSPYTSDGKFLGDEGEIPLEIQKGVSVVINIPGPTVFQARRYSEENMPDVMLRQQQQEEESIQAAPSLAGRAPASVVTTTVPSLDGGPKPLEVYDLFKTLDALRVGLLTNDTETIRGTLEPLDQLLQNTVSTRSKIGSRVVGIEAAVGSSEKINLQNALTASQLEDADYAELWSQLAKEETVLRSSLQAAQKLIQPTLLEFFR